MNCDDAQESLLESMAGPLAPELQAHIDTCEVCGRFAEVQGMLDRRLAAAVPAASLSPHFRIALKARIRRDPTFAWSESLPDIAHLAGCAAGIAASLVLLPWGYGTILAAGAVFTGLTYFLQAVVRDLVA